MLLFELIILWSPAVLIGVLIYYELMIRGFRRQSGPVIKLYGGGFLSRKACWFHIAVLFNPEKFEALEPLLRSANVQLQYRNG